MDGKVSNARSCDPVACSFGTVGERAEAITTGTDLHLAALPGCP